MSKSCLIIGETGTGKSSSIENLDPTETFIISVINKPLPFRSARKNYIRKENGNLFFSDSAAQILKVMKEVNKRENIKTLIIDDYQYIMSNEYMRRALERGFDKFTEIGQNAWQIAKLSSELRDDLDCFILSHSQETETGKFKCKTLGKMIDNNITLEGMFTIVLHSLFINEQYKFLTNQDGTHHAKSPRDMFKENLIENNLLTVKNAINEYYKYFDEDINQ